MIPTLLNHDWVGLFLLLAGVHFLLDYPLQGDFLAMQKNPKFTMRAIPWYHANFAHAAIHGLGVGIVLGSFGWAISELLLHFYIDYKKSMGRFNIHEDQFFHLMCKAFWVFGTWILFTYNLPMW